VVDEDITLQVGADTNVTPSSAQWDFGDGASSATVMASHHWATARTYQVSVRATMPDGQQATTSLSLQVNAKPVAKLTVTAPANGSITGTGISCPPTCTTTVDKGQKLTLTATPAANFKFSGWGGACTGTATCVITMDANKTVSATFTAVSPIQPFVGSWTNVDPNTRNITRVIISNAMTTSAMIHVFGSCTPECDWGITSATYSNGVLHAVYEQGFATQTLTLKLVNGQLVVTDFCDFTVADGRTDFTATDTFRKTG
jgi:hypothetical protein